MKIIIAVGTYTNVHPHVPGACGKGIEVITLDTDTGELTPRTTFSEISDPTYLSWDNITGTLSAISEAVNDDGLISCFSLNEKLELKFKKSIKGPGKAGCFIESYPDLDRLYSTAYVSGKMEGYKTVGGSPVETICSYTYSGSGPNKDRQEAAHAHMAVRSGKHSMLLVSDLGSDIIWKHRLNSSGNALTPEPALKLPGGYGPRHMALSADGNTVFILCELIPRLITAGIDEFGNMSIISDKSTVMNPDENPSNPAAIRIHPCGMSIAVSNRFQDTIGVFRIDNKKAAPEPVLVEEFDCRGNTPRDINFTPDGEWLVIANQDSNNIETRKLNPENGMPEKGWGPGLKTGSPVCLTFLGPGIS